MEENKVREFQYRVDRGLSLSLNPDEAKELLSECSRLASRVEQAEQLLRLANANFKCVSGSNTDALYTRIREWLAGAHAEEKSK